MVGGHETEHPDETEGGPVKSFLEHLEDFRWVLIKSLVALAVAMLLCLIAGNDVVQVIKWPLTRAKIHYPGTNQIAIVNFGTNHLGNFHLTAEQQKSLNLGTNRFVSVQVEPFALGTNQVLGWRVNSDESAITDAQRLHIDLINLSPAGGFFVAFQVALYGGMVLASPFIFYFVVAFIFPALKMREQKYVYRGLFFERLDFFTTTDGERGFVLQKKWNIRTQSCCDFAKFRRQERLAEKFVKREQGRCCVATAAAESGGERNFFLQMDFYAVADFRRL